MAQGKTPKPSEATKAKAAAGPNSTNPDELRETAKAQMEVLKSETDPANDTQPGETPDEPGHVDQKVFSSQDVTSPTDTDKSDPSEATRRLAAAGNTVTDPKELAKIAEAQNEVRNAELDPANDTQPGATYGDPGEPVDRDTLPDPERPEVFSSQDLKSTKVDPSTLHDPTTANTTKFNREPSDTEAKLAAQGQIPPIRR